MYIAQNIYQMALVTQIKKDVKSRNTVHKPTECKCYIFEDKLGNKILQLDTMGSEDREVPGKVSQSIQFNADAIEQLKKILRQF